MGKALSSNTKVYANGYDISGDASAAEIALAPGVADHTTFADLGRKRIRNIHDDQLTYEGFFDDQTGQEDPLLSVLRGVVEDSDMVSVYPNTDVLSKSGFAGTIDNSNLNTPTKLAELVTVKATFGIEGGAQRIKSLGTKATVTGNTSGTGIDDLASSALGGSWYYHIFAISAVGGNARIQIVLQDSANNTDWLTVGTESYNVTHAGGVVGLRHDFTGTLREYVRVSIVKDCTTLSVIYQAGYYRGIATS